MRRELEYVVDSGVSTAAFKNNLEEAIQECSFSVTYPEATVSFTFRINDKRYSSERGELEAALLDFLVEAGEKGTFKYLKETRETQRKELGYRSLEQKVESGEAKMKVVNEV